MKRLALLPLLTLLLTQCQKNDPDPVSQLPPETQTGANTFGCLVNGQPWTPRGFNGNSNYTIYYDANYRKGTLNIEAYRYISENNNYREDIIMFSDGIKASGTYDLVLANHQEALFYGARGQCEFRQNGIQYRRGTFNYPAPRPEGRNYCRHV